MKSKWCLWFILKVGLCGMGETEEQMICPFITIPMHPSLQDPMVGQKCVCSFFYCDLAIIHACACTRALDSRT
ncbi:hypothetical protein B0F90DRAFT_1751674, partial [Multifurca ochricompacta]